MPNAALAVGKWCRYQALLCTPLEPVSVSRQHAARWLCAETCIPSGADAFRNALLWIEAEMHRVTVSAGRPRHPSYMCHKHVAGTRESETDQPFAYRARYVVSWRPVPATQAM